MDCIIIAQCNSILTQTVKHGLGLSTLAVEILEVTKRYGATVRVIFVVFVVPLLSIDYQISSLATETTIISRTPIYDTGRQYFSPSEGNITISHNHLLDAPTLHEDSSNVAIISSHQKLLKKRLQRVIVLPHRHCRKRLR